MAAGALRPGAWWAARGSTRPIPRAHALRAGDGNYYFVDTSLDVRPVPGDRAYTALASPYLGARSPGAHPRRCRAGRLGMLGPELANSIEAVRHPHRTCLLPGACRPRLRQPAREPVLPLLQLKQPGGAGTQQPDMCEGRRHRLRGGPRGGAAPFACAPAVGGCRCCASGRVLNPHNPAGPNLQAHGNTVLLCSWLDADPSRSYDGCPAIVSPDLNMPFHFIGQGGQVPDPSTADAQCLGECCCPSVPTPTAAI